MQNLSPKPEIEIKSLVLAEILQAKFAKSLGCWGLSSNPELDATDTLVAASSAKEAFNPKPYTLDPGP